MSVQPDGSVFISFHPSQQRNSPKLSAIQKVEIVVPAIKTPKRESFAMFFVKALFVSLRALVLFWFVATWFPALGLTYWALLLPVWIASNIFTPISVRGRFIPSDRLERTGYGTEFMELTLDQRKER